MRMVHRIDMCSVIGLDIWSNVLAMVLSGIPPSLVECMVNRAVQMYETGPSQNGDLDKTEGDHAQHRLHDRRIGSIVVFFSCGGIHLIQNLSV